MNQAGKPAVRGGRGGKEARMPEATREELEQAVDEVEQVLRDLRDLKVVADGEDRAAAEGTAVNVLKWLRGRLAAR